MTRNPVRWFVKAAREWGALGVSLFALAVLLVVAAAYFGGPAGYEAVDRDGPGIPPELADHQERAGLERGVSVGAEPSTVLPRPSHFMAYSFIASPNWSGRGTCGPEAIVLHVTGPGSMGGMDSWFRNPASQVSAHFGIGKDGALHQYVEVGDAAWHAGIVNRPNLTNPLIARWVAEGVNPNRCHIGIELLLAGPAEPLVEYPAMAATLDSLLVWLSTTTGIPLDRTHVIGHYELDGVNRATDPRCCVSIDDVLRDLAGPVADTYCCDQPYGGRFNVTRERWEWRPDALWVWRPETGWRCESGCP